jgi:hypothetical protein
LLIKTTKSSSCRFSIFLEILSFLKFTNKDSILSLISSAFPLPKNVFGLIKSDFWTITSITWYLAASAKSLNSFKS